MARMTKRQKEGRKISKKRAARKLRKTALRRFVFVFGAVLLLSVCGSGWWLWNSGEISKQYSRAVDLVINSTEEAGFVVEHIYLSGRHNTPLSDIENAISLVPGDAIFSNSPEEIRTRLEALAKIKHARVERVLPDRLHIQIVEREPIALWQHKGKLSLIDNEGRVIGSDNIEEYAYLPLVVGEDAPEYTAELLRVLVHEPELMKQVESAIRVGGRRWNVRFDNGIEVKLPVTNTKDAWHRLAALASQDNLLQRNILSIDLRIDKHMYIKLPPNAVEPKDKHYKKETNA